MKKKISKSLAKEVVKILDASTENNWIPSETATILSSHNREAAIQNKMRRAANFVVLNRGL